jgi:hypothetical protein
MVVHHIPPLRKLLVCRCTLCSIYILCQYNTIVPFCQQKVFGNGTWEALNDKEIYLKSDRGTQLVNPACDIVELPLLMTKKKKRPVRSAYHITPIEMTP